MDLERNAHRPTRQPNAEAILTRGAFQSFVPDQRSAEKAMACAGGARTCVAGMTRYEAKSVAFVIC